MTARKYKNYDYYGLANAHRPWADTPAGKNRATTEEDDANAAQFHFCDKKEAIEGCLNCTKKSCSGNCAGPETKATKRAVDPKIEERRKRVLELRAKGLIYKEIAEILGCTVKVVNNDLYVMRSKGVYV